MAASQPSEIAGSQQWLPGIAVSGSSAWRLLSHSIESQGLLFKEALHVSQLCGGTAIRDR
jgi:hypothetical protein